MASPPRTTSKGRDLSSWIALSGSGWPFLAARLTIFDDLRIGRGQLAGPRTSRTGALFFAFNLALDIVEVAESLGVDCNPASLPEGAGPLYRLGHQTIAAPRPNIKQISLAPMAKTMHPFARLC